LFAQGRRGRGGWFGGFRGLGVAPLEVCRFGGSTARTSLFVFFFGFSASLISRHYMSDIFALKAWVGFSSSLGFSPFFLLSLLAPLLLLLTEPKNEELKSFLHAKLRHCC